MKNVKIKIVFITLLFFAFYFGCSNNPKEKNDYTFGTVEYVDLEGGFYGITADSGEKLDPVNLEKEYKQDQLRIKFIYRELDSTATIRMWGTPVELTEVKLAE